MNTALNWLHRNHGGQLTFALSPIIDARVELSREEAQAIEHATIARALEYSTGRALARRLLRELGASDPTVPRSPDRSPRWPADYVGSISHCATHCAVVVGRASEYRAVGLDIEPAERIELELYDTIASVAEISRLDLGQRPLEMRRLFVAKEATYKCLHPVLGLFLEFHDIDITFDARRRRFTARVTHPEAMGLAIDGVFREDHDLFYGLAVMSARDAVAAS